MVSSAKVNPRAFLHAGVVMTVAYVATGYALAATSGAPASPVTVNLSRHVVGIPRPDECVEITVTPIRVGRRLAAGTATLATNRPIAEVSALFMPTARVLAGAAP